MAVCPGRTHSKPTGPEFEQENLGCWSLCDGRTRSPVAARLGSRALWPGQAREHIRSGLSASTGKLSPPADDRVLQLLAANLPFSLPYLPSGRVMGCLSQANGGAWKQKRQVGDYWGDGGEEWQGLFVAPCYLSQDPARVPAVAASVPLPRSGKRTTWVVVTMSPC